MSESELRKAQQEVHESNQRFERAMDHLKDKIEEGTERVEHLRQHGVDDMVYKAKASAQEFIGERQGMIENVIDDLVGTFVTRVRSALGFLEERPVRTWTTVFMAGFVLGAVVSRRRQAMGNPQLRPVETDFMIEESETDEFDSEAA